MEEYIRENPVDFLTKNRLRELLQRSRSFLSDNQEQIEAAYAHYAEVWEEIIDEIRRQRIIKGAILIASSAIGITATVLTFRALGPEAVSMETALLGSFALAFDMSNMGKGVLELYYGCTGNIETTALNLIRESIFFGWQEEYDVACLGVNIGFSYSSMLDMSVAAGVAAEGRIVEGVKQHWLSMEMPFGKWEHMLKNLI